MILSLHKRIFTCYLARYVSFFQVHLVNPCNFTLIIVFENVCLLWNCKILQAQFLFNIHHSSIEFNISYAERIHMVLACLSIFDEWIFLDHKNVVIFFFQFSIMSLLAYSITSPFCPICIHSFHE